MREDQRKRLADLSEKLAETALMDADPENWTGNGQVPADLSQEDRGHAVWCRKLALSTLSVLASVARLQADQPQADTPEEDDNVEDDIRKAESDAARLLKGVMADARKHGAKAKH